MKCDNFALLLEVVLLKKALCLFLSLFLVVFLPACSSDSGNAPPPEVSSTAETAPDPIPESDNPLLSSEFTVCDVLSGTGKIIGSRGSVSVSKTDLPDLSSPEFAAYMTEFVDNRISGNKYNYVTIFFDDGTGFIFPGGNDTLCVYCRPDSDGSQSTLSLGECSRADGFQFIDYEIRSIPDFTIKQEALVGENYFEPVPSEIFSTTAEENGLADMSFYADGEIVSRSDVGGYDTIQVATEEGDLYISAVLVDLPEISEGEAVTVYFVYTGWSDMLGGACGAYVYSE